MWFFKELHKSAQRRNASEPIDHNGCVFSSFSVEVLKKARMLLSYN